jgi:hypothetical protein
VFKDRKAYKVYQDMDRRVFKEYREFKELLVHRAHKAYKGCRVI